MQIYTKQSTDMYFVHTCIIIILAFSFFNGSLLQKIFVKVIEDLEILRGSEKFVLAIVMSTKRFAGWYQTKMLKRTIKFNIVTGTNGIQTGSLEFYQTVFFWKLPEQPFTDILKNGLVKHFAKFTEKHLCCSFFDKVVGFQSSSSAAIMFLWTLQYY